MINKLDDIVSAVYMAPSLLSIDSNDQQYVYITGDYNKNIISYPLFMFIVALVILLADDSS
jgi:hypothetical protein